MPRIVSAFSRMALAGPAPARCNASSTASARTIGSLTTSLGQLRIAGQPSVSQSPAASSSRTFASAPRLPSGNTLRPSGSFLSSCTTLSSTNNTSVFVSPLGALRFATYGQEYQPSQRKRKRKHGFLARLRAKRSLGGPNMLRRRKRLGRRFLSH